MVRKNINNVNLKVADDIVNTVEAKIGDSIKDALTISERNERYDALENIKA